MKEVRNMITEQKIEKIKKTTDLCNTFCCYENCYKCVEKYLKYKSDKE
jgi:hypothetical protein